MADRIPIEEFLKKQRPSTVGRQTNFQLGGQPLELTSVSAKVPGGTASLAPLGVEQRKADIDIEKAKRTEGIKGPSGEIAGRIALSKESLGNVDDILGILFPSGKPESFDRETALGSNIPGSTLPLLGRIIPSSRPDNPLDPTDDEKAFKAQTVFRKTGAILSGRQLIQTGVAARPEETEKLIKQFSPKFLSSPRATFDGLLELKEFYKEFLRTTDPTGAKGARVFASVEEAEAMDLPKGTEVTISTPQGLRRARVE